jgi:predicted RNA-binding protein with PUA-like domain
MAASARQYWLLKSEPGVFSIEDLAASSNQTTCWDGVRNYQARNFLRDDFRVGDRAFFYHSSTDRPAIVGTMTVVRAGYPDPTAYDPSDPHFDPKSDPARPVWFAVDVMLLQRFPKSIDRDQLGAERGLQGMEVLRRGSRLSIQPVTPAEWTQVHRLAGVRDP